MRCRRSYLSLILLSCLLPVDGLRYERYDARKTPRREAVTGLADPHCWKVRAIIYFITSDAILLVANKMNRELCDIIFGANVTILGLWYVSLLDEDFHRWMNKHFLLSYNLRRRTRLPHTMLTSGFSHASWSHLAANMSALLSFGPKLEKRLGRRLFVYIYLAAIHAADVFDTTIFQPISTSLLPRRRQPIGSLGASGAVFCAVTLFCLEFPRERIILAREPVRAPFGLVYLVLSELLHALLESDSQIGHGAHIGGSLFGLFIYALRHICGKMKYWIPHRLQRRRRWHNY